MTPPFEGHFFVRADNEQRDHRKVRVVLLPKDLFPTKPAPELGPYDCSDEGLRLLVKDATLFYSADTAKRLFNEAEHLRRISGSW